MAYEEYPKPSAHPSKSVGEQEDTDWPEHARTRYPNQGGAGSTRYDGDKSKTTHLSGGMGGDTGFGERYPKKKAPAFGTETHRGS